MIKLQSALVSIGVAIALSLACVSCIITVNIGGANRLTSLDRQRDRYNCYWDCDLVGCQISSDDDECAYDCEKICRPRYDWARSSSQQDSLTEKSGAINALNIEEKSTINMLSKLSGKSGLVAPEPMAVNKGEPVATTANGDDKRIVEGKNALSLSLFLVDNN